MDFHSNSDNHNNHIDRRIYNILLRENYQYNDDKLLKFKYALWNPRTLCGLYIRKDRGPQYKFQSPDYKRIPADFKNSANQFIFTRYGCCVKGEFVSFANMSEQYLKYLIYASRVFAESKFGLPINAIDLHRELLIQYLGTSINVSTMTMRELLIATLQKKFNDLLVFDSANEEHKSDSDDDARQQQEELVNGNSSESDGNASDSGSDISEGYLRNHPESQIPDLTDIIIEKDEVISEQAMMIEQLKTENVEQAAEQERNHKQQLAEKDRMIEQLKTENAEQAQIIGQLQTTIVEQAGMIEQLQTTIVEQAGNHKQQLAEKDRMNEQLQTTIVEQARNHEQQLAEKDRMIEQLKTENVEQARNNTEYANLVKLVQQLTTENAEQQRRFEQKIAELSRTNQQMKLEHARKDAMNKKTKRDHQETIASLKFRCDNYERRELERNRHSFVLLRNNNNRVRGDIGTFISGKLTLRVDDDLVDSSVSRLRLHIIRCDDDETTVSSRSTSAFT